MHLTLQPRELQSVIVNYMRSMKPTPFQPEIFSVLSFFHDTDITIPEELQVLHEHALHIHYYDLVALASSSEILSKSVIL